MNPCPASAVHLAALRVPGPAADASAEPAPPPPGATVRGGTTLARNGGRKMAASFFSACSRGGTVRRRGAEDRPRPSCERHEGRHRSVKKQGGALASAGGLALHSGAGSRRPGSGGARVEDLALRRVRGALGGRASAPARDPQGRGFAGVSRG